MPTFTVAVYVKPGSTKGPLVEVREDGVMVVFVRARAIEGAASRAVGEQLAQYYGVATSQVRLRTGHTARHKRYEITTSLPK